MLSGHGMNELLNMWISVRLFYKILSGRFGILGVWPPYSFAIIWHIIIQNLLPFPLWLWRSSVLNIPEASLGRNVLPVTLSTSIFAVIVGHRLVNVKWKKGFRLDFFFSFLHIGCSSLSVFILTDSVHIVERVQTLGQGDLGWNSDSVTS